MKNKPQTFFKRGFALINFKELKVRLFFRPGLTLVGVLTAATVGTIVVTGLTQLSVNTMETMKKSQRTAQSINLGEEISQALKQGPLSSCTGANCYNACTSTLKGYTNTKGHADDKKSVVIRRPSSTPGVRGQERYKKDQIHQDIRIQEIQFRVRDGKGAVSTTVDRNKDGRTDSADVRENPDLLVYFALSGDARDSLSSTAPLEFPVNVISYEGSTAKIKECAITAGGAMRTPCYRAEGKKTLVGCGGTEHNRGGSTTAFGHSAGSRLSTGGGNTFVGYEAGKDVTTGTNNIFLGHGAGKNVATGTNNIYIGKGLTGSAGDTNKLNIGKLITGKLIGSKEIQVKGKVIADDGIHSKGKVIADDDIHSKGGNISTKNELHVDKKGVIDGSLTVGGNIHANSNIISNKTITAVIDVFGGGKSLKEAYNKADRALSKATAAKKNADDALAGVHSYRGRHEGTRDDGGSDSSKVYKKNIQPFQDFERSLEHILNTPLFTYQYKKKHPDKNRMGIISEELPQELQIKDEGAPSHPDWVSIYGTLWAGIKALTQRLDSFKEKTKIQLQAFSEKLQKTEDKAEQNKGELLNIKKRLAETESDLKQKQGELEQTKNLLKENEKILQKYVKTLDETNTALKHVSGELNELKRSAQADARELRETKSRLKLIEKKVSQKDE